MSVFHTSTHLGSGWLKEDVGKLVDDGSNRVRRAACTHGEGGLASAWVGGADTRLAPFGPSLAPRLGGSKKDDSGRRGDTRGRFRAVERCADSGIEGAKAGAI